MTGMPAYPTTTLDPSRRTGLILCGMGGPDGPADVEPFLRNLFRDPAIFPLPRLVRPLLAWLIASRRAPAVRARYQAIDPVGRSPQLAMTRQQVDILVELLHEEGLDVEAACAMRYWHPFARAVVTELLDRRVKQFLIVPAYPQFSLATSGTTLDNVLEAVDYLTPDTPVHVLREWHLLPGYLDTVAVPVIEQLKTWAVDGMVSGQCALLYVAHSLPESFVAKGDPYLDQTRATVAAVHERVADALVKAGHEECLKNIVGEGPPPLVFQSKLGPIKWVGPEITAEVQKLAAQGVQHLFIQPVSFTCEHVETLHELDIELQQEAWMLGIRDFRRGPALNLAPGWLRSLAGALSNSAFDQEAAGHG